MNIPKFTAQASLYRTRGNYHTFKSESDSFRSGDGIFPAYMPGSGTQKRCSDCLKTCAEGYAWCAAGATALLAGCIFPPLCPAAAAAAGAALAGCNTASLLCTTRCKTPDPLGACCPKICSVSEYLVGGLLFNPGAGCCDAGEHCVDANDPNSRRGCCPSDQSVCGGRCCAKGENCCGDSCCPPNYFCLDGGVCSEFPGPLFGPPERPPKPPPGRFETCMFGWTPCKGGCCAPGLECCTDGVCRWTCIH